LQAWKQTTQVEAQKKRLEGKKQNKQTEKEDKG
jgi:hypothetical protein